MNPKKSSLKQYFDFLWVMTEKEIKLRYKKTILGFLWVLLNPLLQMAIIGFVFSFFIKIPNYFLFLLTGLLPWTFFSNSINKATASIVNERRLLQKTKFPIEVVPLSVVLSNFVNLVISLVLLLIYLLLTRMTGLTNILYLVPAIAWLLALSFGLSLLTSSFYVRYRDVGYIVRTTLILGFYLTPVLYSLSLIPPNLRGLFAINPLTTIFQLFHLALLEQGAIYNRILFFNILFSLVLIFLGLFVFKKKQRQFVDWT